MSDYNLLVLFRSGQGSRAEEEIRRLVHENGYILDRLELSGSNDMFYINVAGDPWDLVLNLMNSPEKLIYSAGWIPLECWKLNNEGQIEIVIEDPSEWTRGNDGMMRLRKKNRK